MRTRSEAGRHGSLWLPFIVYAAVTVGIPLLGGAGRGGGFVEHAAMTLLVPALLLLAGSVARRLVQGVIQAVTAGPARACSGTRPGAACGMLRAGRGPTGAARGALRARAATVRRERTAGTDLRPVRGAQ